MPQTYIVCSKCGRKRPESVMERASFSTARSVSRFHADADRHLDGPPANEMRCMARVTCDAWAENTKKREAALRG